MWSVKRVKNGTWKMDETLEKALSQPDIDDILISAVEHADTTMRIYYWRGFKPKSSKLEKELIVGDKTAKDFVYESLTRLCSGKRTYNPQRSLLDNLNSVTDSIISSEKKASDRTGIIDFTLRPDESDNWPDPLTSKAGNELPADKALIQSEVCEAQGKCFATIKASFDGSKSIQDYLDALSQGFFDIDEIHELTDIPVPQIYEIRRKLKKYALRFFSVANFAALERKIESPQK